MAFEFITKDRFVQIESFALANPPTWTRLEPQSLAGDPRPGIEARVHDPLWLLGRQWQLGEFEGEDAGTPLTVRVVTRTAPIDRWAPGCTAPGDANEEALPPARSFSREPVEGFAAERHQDLLEPLVEREPVAIASPGLRARAEAGAVLLAALDDAALGAHRATIIAQCPLVLDPLQHPDGAHASLDPQWGRLARLLQGGNGGAEAGAPVMADGESICEAVEAAGGIPPWLVPADAAEATALLAAIEPWRAWYRAEVSPRDDAEDAWAGERLEYRFRAGAGATVLEAPSHRGGEIDWHTFDAAPGVPLEDPAGAPPAPAEIREMHVLLASPLRYPGMPADRLWEMEDAQVNLGLVEAEPWDLARLLVAEFALTYGNDWLVVPVDVPFGSLTRIESVLYTTTFGEHFVVRPTEEVSPDGRWRMFAITTASGEGSDGLLIPPGAVAVQDGPPIEEVLFLRDEMANMAWAVERTIQGPSGAARDRARERDDPRRPQQGPVDAAELDYLLQTGVPARWIPYVAQSAGYRSINLVRGSMPGPDGAAVAPLGKTLRRADTRILKDAEIPREGVMVRRLTSVTRRADGAYERWTTRRVGVGRGEGASQLAFDSAFARKSRPNA
jgi:hypothetical protein